MARPRHRSTLTVSLFPFLSVLAAVMGTLTLVISGMTLLSLQNSTQVVEPPPRGSTKTPVYVECRQEGLLFQPEGRAVPRDEIEQKDGPWLKRLDEIAKNHTKQYVVFLIRPNGVEAFRDALWLAENKKIDEDKDLDEDNTIDIGFDAVYANGPLKFRQTDEGTTL